MESCDECGASGVRLWREYQTFRVRLLCTDHAAIDQGVNPEEVSDDATAIKWWVPAIRADDEPGVYWGYLAIPPAELTRWRALPRR